MLCHAIVCLGIVYNPIPDRVGHWTRSADAQLTAHLGRPIVVIRWLAERDVASKADARRALMRREHSTFFVFLP